MSAVRNERSQPSLTGAPVRNSLFVEKVPAGWRLDLDGVRRHFGTSFLAIRTAIQAAHDSVAAGRPTSVFVQRSDGGWRTAWSSDDSSFA